MLSSLFDRWSLRRQIVLVAGGAIPLFGLGAAEFVRRDERHAFERTFGERTSKLVGTLAAASLDAVPSLERPVLDTVIAAGIWAAPALLVLGLVDALLVRPVRVIHERLRELDAGADLPPLEFAGASTP